MGFARICFFDGALWRRFGNEDLFFFFCSSRPMMYDFVCLYEAKIGIGLVAVQTFDCGDATQNCPTLIRSGSKSWRASPSLSVQPYRHVPGKRPPHTRSNSWRRHGSHHHLTQPFFKDDFAAKQDPRLPLCLLGRLGMERVCGRGQGRDGNACRCADGGRDRNAVAGTLHISRLRTFHTALYSDLFTIAVLTALVSNVPLCKL
jgi:hypothetical protein